MARVLTRENLGTKTTTENPFECNFLVLGGGGGGGGNFGGGGAGGYITSWRGAGAEKSGGDTTPVDPLLLSLGAHYVVTVGAGGYAHGAHLDYGGGDSRFHTILAYGGGGGNYSSTAGKESKTALIGSGGGGSISVPTGVTSVTAGQGFAGGNFYTASGTGRQCGGGGGGAGAVGDTPSGSDTTTTGGAGLASTITGTSVARGGGGGGAHWVSGVVRGDRCGIGGAGGGGWSDGGDGGSYGPPATWEQHVDTITGYGLGNDFLSTRTTGGLHAAGSVTATLAYGRNKGGGGGGGQFVGATDGGGGVVILRVPDTVTAFFGLDAVYTKDTTTVAGYDIYVITHTGSFTGASSTDPTFSGSSWVQFLAT